MKFIHAADIHLGAEPDKGTPWSGERKQDIYDTFRRLIREVNERQADFLFLSGDIFHKTPTVQDLRELDHMLGGLHTAKTVLIAGNHDHMREGIPWEFHSDVCVLGSRELSSVYFEEEGTCVSGFSYWSREIREERYRDAVPPDVDAVHILLAHGGDAGHIPIDHERLKWSGFDYIALGHIHKPGILYEDLMAYAGSLEPLDATETGPHGYLFGEITEEKQIVTFVPFAKRCYQEAEIVIYDTMSATEIYDTIRTELIRMGAENIFRIRLSGYADPKLRLDFDELYEEFRILSIDTASLTYGDYDALLQENRDNLIGIVMEKLKDNPEALSYAMKALLSTMDETGG